jgi:hypothetical protein
MLVEYKVCVYCTTCTEDAKIYMLITVMFLMTKRLNIPIEDSLFERLERLPGPMTAKVRDALEEWIPGEEKRLLEELKKGPAIKNENNRSRKPSSVTQYGGPT